MILALAVSGGIADCLLVSGLLERRFQIWDPEVYQSGKQNSDKDYPQEEHFLFPRHSSSC
jgi:hypothetical protein